jgi:diguanylate cyclase (GGDEF)-like protein
MTLDSTELAALARDKGVADVFVFRRISGNRLAHLGGVGRGEGWAGIVEVELNVPSLLRDALTDERDVWLESDQPANVFGPYYAQSAVAIPSPPDAVVVLGSPDSDLRSVGEATLHDLARGAASAIEQVSPAKPLADELEVLHAVQAMSGIVEDSVDAVMSRVASCAAEALSCEVAIVYLAESDRVAIADDGWPSPADAERILSAIRTLDPSEVSCPLCVQDVTERRLPEPFGPENGVCSFYLLELGEPAGYLLLLHTDARPRGFTLLCRELGLKLADIARDVLGRALERERHRVELDRMREQAHRDPLTGVANRHAWLEVVGAADGANDVPVSIVMVDVDRLKQTNDSQGHPVGDALLRQTAARLTAGVRGDDVVARIGGDEFAVLLYGTDAAACANVVWRLENQIGIQERGDDHGPPLAITVGFATREAGSSEPLAHTIEVADQMLLERKHEKRLRLIA